MEAKKMSAKIENQLRREVRSMPVSIDDSQDQKMLIQGYAIRFNEPAVFDVDGVEYREVIDPRALDKTDMRDVPLRYNHSDNVMVMARTRNKTLQLIKDDEGLRILADLANTTAGRDLYELIKRGDVDKMSFAFTVARDDYDVETRTRRILAIDKIFDVSAVDSPAYETTSISVRSYFEVEAEKQRIALERAARRKRLILKTYL
jgi:hypothetical protein